MKNTIPYLAAMLLFFVPALVGAQALPHTVSDADPVILAKGGAGLTETGSISHAAFTNAAAIPFSNSSLDVTAGYMMFQPSAVRSDVISAGVAYNLNNKIGFAAGFYYGMNPEFGIINANGLESGTFKPSDLHAAVGVSYRFLDFMSVGVNFGYARSSLMEKVSYGTVAADAFVMAKFKGVKLAAGVSNILGSIESANGIKFRLPASAALGAGYDINFAERHVLEASLDLDYFFSGELAASVGAGYTFNDLISIRAGYRYGGDSVIPSYASIGAGVKVIGIKLDVAYLIAGTDSPMKNTLAVGVGYSF